MYRSLLVAATCACCLVGLSAARGADAQPPRTLDFELRDAHGRAVRLADHQDQKAVVLVFLGAECPLARLYGPRLVELAKEYGPRGVTFLGVDANTHDTPSEMLAYTQAYKIEFPLLKDAENKLADQLGATRTPEVFVLDPTGKVRYHGRVDDQYAVGAQRDKPARRDLAIALDELLDGKDISTATTPLAGCLISKVRRVAPHGDVTYTKHIAAIVNAHCVECHRAGELAPFTLSSYDDVVAWADTIREVVDANRMPPWFADPEHGKFSNDCSLSAEKKQTLHTWIDNGCPQGDPADLPAPPVFTAGWRMGSEPDRVYRMPQPFTVAAEGTVDYQYFQIDPDLKEELWVSIAEARPGNAAVVHHVVLFAVPPSRKVKNLEDAQVAGQMIAVYAPGMNPWRYPPGMAMKLEKGSQLILQLHYTPNGAAQDDSSYVGLKLAAPETVKQQVRYGLVSNAGFVIPPHADNHEVKQATRIYKDVKVLNFFPHMHYRGKAFRFEAEYPDGRREVLLDVPHYDFSWQLRYDLAEPKLLPKGTRLECIAHYDNSAANPHNPDPSATVRFGLQSWEEMLVGYYTSIPAEDDRTASKE